MRFQVWSILNYEVFLLRLNSFWHMIGTCHSRQFSWVTMVLFEWSYFLSHQYQAILKRTFVNYRFSLFFCFHLSELVVCLLSSAWSISTLLGKSLEISLLTWFQTMYIVTSCWNARRPNRFSFIPIFHSRIMYIYISEIIVRIDSVDSILSFSPYI